MNIFDVVISLNAKKQLTKLPRHIIHKLNVWIDSVEKSGLRQVQKISGFHDEPLKGKRKQQRSID
jgi:proteic killer suppression protein